MVRQKPTCRRSLAVCEAVQLHGNAIRSGLSREAAEGIVNNELTLDSIRSRAGSRKKGIKRSLLNEEATGRNLKVINYLGFKPRITSFKLPLKAPIDGK